MDLESFAKINLYLKVGRKLKSGYHQIQSVMQTVELADKLQFKKIPEDKIVIESNHKGLESSENLVHKAAELIKNEFKIKDGVHITLTKNIPLAAGLGGGSSNAAHTLVALNKLFKLKLTDKKLEKLGMEIGSDVPFFIWGHASKVEGIGDKVTHLKNPQSFNFVLVNPNIPVSTKWAYGAFDKYKPKVKPVVPKIDDCVKAVQQRNAKALAKVMYNDFDGVLDKKYPEIKKIRSHLRKYGALKTMVVGSGSTVMGLYESIYTAREAFYKLRDLYPFVYLTKTI